MTLKETASENIVRKGKNADNQHFFLFLTAFFPFSYNVFYHMNCLPNANILGWSNSKHLQTKKKKNVTQILKTVF